MFQVGGAGAVGTGSIRGIPLLARLREAGFAIWPFNPASLPLVVEIYPRALTGRVVKSVRAARRQYLDAWGWPRDLDLRARVAETEDAFDAAVSARQMARHASEFTDLPELTAIERIEGRIWLSSNQGTHMEAVESPVVRARRRELVRLCYDAISAAYRDDEGNPKRDGGAYRPVQGLDG